MTIKELQSQRKAALDAAKAISATAKAEDRELTDDELEASGAHMDAVAQFNEDEKVLEAKVAKQAELQAAMDAETARLSKPQPRVAAYSDPQESAQINQVDAATADVAAVGGKPKWSGLGDFLTSVAGAERRDGGPIDPRLIAPSAAITGHNESVQSEGGFLVETDQMTSLMQRVYNNTAMIAGGAGYGGVARIPISANANGVKINSFDETSRANGSRWGGIQAYWLAEGGAKTASQTSLRQTTLELKKLIGLSYATDELLQDAAALEAVISNAFVGEFSFKIQEALMNGTGGGTPLGLMNSNVLVTVPKEGGQAANTVVTENINKMWAQMYPPSLPNSVWFINQNVWPELFNMTLDIGTGGSATYLPPGGLSQSPYGTLMGRPVVPIEQCATLGTVGDIVFADMSQYLFADKGGTQSESSIHVRFIYDESVFRFVFRCDGTPAWNAPLTPYKDSVAGSDVSPYIALATRA